MTECSFGIYIFSSFEFNDYLDDYNIHSCDFDLCVKGLLTRSEVLQP